MHEFRKLADVNLLKKMQLIYHNHHFERWILNIETDVNLLKKMQRIYHNHHFARWILNIETLFTEIEKVVESSFIQIHIKKESSS